MKIGNRYDQKLIEKQKVNTHFIQILELADSYIKITFINMLKKIRKENGKIDKNNGWFEQVIETESTWPYRYKNIYYLK